MNWNHLSQDFFWILLDYKGKSLKENEYELKSLLKFMILGSLKVVLDKSSSNSNPLNAPQLFGGGKGAYEGKARTMWRGKFSL